MKPGQTKRLALRKGSLLFEEHSPHAVGERWGNVHFALPVPRYQLEQAVEHLRRNGLEPHGPTYFEWRQAKSYSFSDPDGNRVEFWSQDPPWLAK